jgi:hypothetical protein
MAESCANLDSRNGDTDRVEFLPHGAVTFSSNSLHYALVTGVAAAF